MPNKLKRIQTRFLSILEATALIAAILIPAVASVKGAHAGQFRSFNQYERFKERMENNQPDYGAPSRFFQYRDEQGFYHNCHEQGGRIDCDN